MNKHIEKCNKYRQDFINFIKKREEENKIKVLNDDDKLLNNIIFRLIKKDGMEIKNIPFKYVDYKLCLEAVKQNGLAIKYIFSIPVANVDFEKMSKICKYAIRNNPLSLQYFTDKYITEKICCDSIYRLKKQGKFKELFELIDYIPEKYKDYDFYYNLLSYNPNIIKKVPENILNERMCYEAVILKPFILEYIPEKYKTFSLCKTAVFKEGDIHKYNYISHILFKYIPREYRDDIISLAEHNFGRSYH